MEEKIRTKHPEAGKRGVHISRAKYDQVRRAIESALRAGGELTFAELGAKVEKKLTGKFEGSIMWYYVSVKLDLEARRVLERVPGSRPQKIRLK